MNGPVDLKIFRNKYFVTVGAIMDSTYEALTPLGCLLIINKSNISTVLTSSIKTDKVH